jgi:hypothetical protein
MGAFSFRLGRKDGTPADPPTLKAAVPNWGPGDLIALSRARALRVVDIPDDDADQAPVLVVEETGPEGPLRPDLVFRRLEGRRLGSKRVAFDCPGPSNLERHASMGLVAQ